jgi:very-short-patch-repair endonuclease
MLSKRLRQEATPAERVLRTALRSRQMRGVKFRFIHPVLGFLLDFYAPSIRLCVEVDGSVHDSQIEEDEERTRLLAQVGIAVLRLRNEEILSDLPRALARIEAAVLSRPMPVHAAPAETTRRSHG